MDDYFEFDIRKIIRKTIKTILINWYWVLLPAVLFGLVTFVFFLSRPEQPALYQAQATITLTDPRYPKLVDPLTEPIVPSRISDAAVRKVLEYERIVTPLFELWDCSQGSNCTLNAFINNHLKVQFPEPEDDEEEPKGLIILTVTTWSRNNAIVLANTWSELAIEMDPAAFYYADQNAILRAETAAEVTALIDAAVFQASDPLNSLDMFLDFTRPRVEDAAQGLIDFEQDNTLEALQNELDDQLDNREDTVQALRNLEDAQEGIRMLLNQLAFEANDAILDPGLRQHYLEILNKIFNIPGSPHYLLTITGGGQPIDTRTVAEFSLMLAHLQKTIEPRLFQLEKKQENINADILQLQTRIESLKNEKSVLELAHQTLSDEYEKIFKIYQEVLFYEAVALPAEVTLVKFATTTTESQPAVSPNTMGNTAIAAGVGVLIGIVGVLVVNWWQRGVEELE
jgi:predicted  nucleic acid-binding Zn-ribbon protein